MRPTLATVISPRPWEARLVQEIAESGLVRLVARAYDPRDIPRIDVVVVGTETPWLDPARIGGWRLRGTAVIGVFAAGDRAAINLLCRAGADQLFVESAEPIVILRAARELATWPVATSG